jgi:hypothetical protein
VGKAENELTKEILDYLNTKYKRYCVEDKKPFWRNNNIAVRGRTFIGQKGVGDITGILPPKGIRVEIEVKDKGKVPSIEQEDIREMIQNAGGIWLWCDSFDMFKEKWLLKEGIYNE